jgi:FixJ family two-component response regulator
MTSPTAGPVIHIVDDDASFLHAASRLLRASGFAVKTFASAADFFSQRDQDAVGCLVVDLQMPEMDGLELQAALARTRNPLPTLFLTAHGDIPSSVRAMRGGAEDFLGKTAPKAELLDAIRRAVARDARERKTRAQRREANERIATLSEREREVFGHVIRGRLNKQIADDLRISERTVKHHRGNITTKLGVPSVAELTRLAHEAGIF